MSKHIMEQHESKHVLSQRRKVPKTKESSKEKNIKTNEKIINDEKVENECTEKEEDWEDMECREEETITIQRKEMENLQDLLVQKPKKMKC